MAGQGEPAGEAAPLVAGAAEKAESGHGGMVSACRHGTETRASRRQESASAVAKHGRDRVCRARSEGADMPARWRRSAHRRSTTPAGDALTAYPQPEGVSEQESDGHLSPEAFAELMEDVRGLRLTLALDLSAAAGAADVGEDAVAASIVEADRQELLTFMRDANARLNALEDEVPVESSRRVAVAPTGAAHGTWRRRALISLPAVPLVGALAVSAAAAAGALPLPNHASAHIERPRATAPAPVASSFRQFETVLKGDPSASQVINAASALHQQMAALLDSATHDPSRVAEVAKLLQLEQALLIRTRVPGCNVALAASQQLVAKLLTLAPRVLVTPSVSTYARPTTRPSHHHANTTTAKPSTASSSTSSSPKSSTAPASHSPSPTPSSTSPSGYPTKIPYVGG
jgi:hypothetical protein